MFLYLASCKVVIKWYRVRSHKLSAILPEFIPEYNKKLTSKRAYADFAKRPRTINLTIAIDEMLRSVLPSLSSDLVNITFAHFALCFVKSRLHASPRLLYAYMFGVCVCI